MDAAMVQGSDTKFFKEVCGIYRRYKNNILSVAVESNGFQVYFLRELQSYAEEEGLTLPLTAVKNSLKKEHRIARLVPLFETDKICFEPEFRRSRAGKILIEQLLYFPSSAVHDDGPNALDGAVKVLEARTSAGSGISFLPRAIKKGFRSSFSGESSIFPN